MANKNPAALPNYFMFSNVLSVKSQRFAHRNHPPGAEHYEADTAKAVAGGRGHRLDVDDCPAHYVTH
jgi:hypothetical protein